jgi:hypothetical protein
MSVASFADDRCLQGEKLVHSLAAKRDVPLPGASMSDTPVRTRDDKQEQGKTTEPGDAEEKMCFILLS